jgi:hypothetical protein
MITVVVNGTHTGIWNEETGHDGKPDFSQHVPISVLFHWHVQNATIPWRSQELFPFLSVMYFVLPPFSTNYSSILSHLISPSIS